MQRRLFIAQMLGPVLAPITARAQQAPAKIYRIGVLETVPLAQNSSFAAFKAGMSELGRVEGRDYIVEYRSPDGDALRFPLLANELLALGVDVIVTRGTPAALAAKKATPTVPIIMASSGDPLGAGIVESLARPGGNITGMSAFATEIAGKRVELAKNLLPAMTRIGLLANMSNPVSRPQWEETKKASAALGLEVDLFDVRNRSDIDRAFETAAARKIDAVLIAQDTVTQTYLQRIVSLAEQTKVPVIYASREFVEGGGLMSFRVNYKRLYFRVASLVDKVLKGAWPGDIPVEQPTQLELVINLKAAKLLGISIPPDVLLRADEVIE